MNKRKGFFIAFEGIDGLGKSTQIARLADFLTSQGLRVRRTREPTDSEYGREIRRIAASGREGVTLDVELELFLKDRELDVRQNILPGLDAGEVVLVDRYFYSNIAYQGALGLDVSVIRAANESRFPAPDLVLLMDALPATGIARIHAGRGEANNLGYEQADYLEKVRANFHAMRDANIVRIDAEREADAIADEIRTVVTNRIVNKRSKLSQQ